MDESARTRRPSELSGDEKAFDLLIRRHYRSVYGAAIAVVHERAAAEDLAQDAFLIAWMKQSTLRNPKSFGGWVRRIVRNLALNWSRSREYRRRLSERYAADRDGEVHEVGAPDTDQAAAMRSAAIWSALDRLTPK